MAESSGFFTAMIDEDTGGYDRAYIARQFADYFSLFIGNGVFGSPTNQLLVKPGTNGLSVIVSQGYAFIHGYWYYNDSDKVIPLVTNYGSVMRTDTVRVRMSEETRDIKVDVFTDDIELERGEDIFDLQLAKVQVPPFAESITASHIQDTRPDQTVCGFVTGLMSVQTTADLFAQYQAMFDEWFETMKDQLSEDAAGSLQNQIDVLISTVSNFENSLGRISIVDLYSTDGLIPANYNYDENGCGYINIPKEYFGWISSEYSALIVGFVGQNPDSGFDRFYQFIPFDINIGSFSGRIVGFNLTDGNFYIREIEAPYSALESGHMLMQNGVKIGPCREITIGEQILKEQLWDKNKGTSKVNQDAIRITAIFAVRRYSS